MNKKIAQRVFFVAASILFAILLFFLLDLYISNYLSMQKVIPEGETDTRGIGLALSIILVIIYGGIGTIVVTILYIIAFVISLNLKEKKNWLITQGVLLALPIISEVVIFFLLKAL